MRAVALIMLVCLTIASLVCFAVSLSPLTTSHFLRSDYEKEVTPVTSHWSAVGLEALEDTCLCRVVFRNIVRVPWSIHM